MKMQPPPKGRPSSLVTWTMNNVERTLGIEPNLSSWWPAVLRNTKSAKNVKRLYLSPLLTECQSIRASRPFSSDASKVLSQASGVHKFLNTHNYCFSQLKLVESDGIEPPSPGLMPGTPFAVLTFQFSSAFSTNGEHNPEGLNCRISRHTDKLGSGGWI